MNISFVFTINSKNKFLSAPLLHVKTKLTAESTKSINSYPLYVYDLTLFLYIQNKVDLKFLKLN